MHGVRVFLPNPDLEDLSGGLVLSNFTEELESIPGASHSPPHPNSAKGLTEMLRVFGRVFCSTSLLSVYMCVRMPPSLSSITGVPSSRALPGFPICGNG